MARFVHIDFPTEHGGVNRISRGFEALGSFSITRGALHALAVIGSPVTRLVGKIAAARRERKADEQLWNIALTDARVMADLSRAMSREATRDARYF